MSAPSLNKLNNPYLDTALLDSLDGDQIKTQKTQSMEDPTSEPNDDSKQNSKNDDFLQSILNLDSLEMKSDEYKPIQINVGGIKYESTKATLCKYSTSTLSNLITNKIYFIDRDGFIFKYILNYLRNNTLILPKYDNNYKHENNKYLISELLFEAKYYAIQPLIDELIMMKINSTILSTCSNHFLQKKHIHNIRHRINQEYPKLTKRFPNGLIHEWKIIFKYDCCEYNLSIPPSKILQTKCGGLRSVLIIFVVMNQIFAVYFYEPWNDKAYRQKNFFYWIGQYLNDGLHKNKFDNFSGKKFKCTYSFKGEIVAQYTPSKSKGDSNTLNKDYQIAFSFDSTKQNNLILTNLKGLPIKELAMQKDHVAVSMCEVFHISLRSKS